MICNIQESCKNSGSMYCMDCSENLDNFFKENLTGNYELKKNYMWLLSKDNGQGEGNDDIEKVGIFMIESDLETFQKEHPIESYESWIIEKVRLYS